MKSLLLFAFALHAATAIVESRGEARIQVPDHGEMLLMDFRTASIETWKVKKATLALHLREGSPPKTVLLSTIPSRWTEEDPSPAAKGLFVSRGGFQPGTWARAGSESRLRRSSWKRWPAARASGSPSSRTASSCTAAAQPTTPSSFWWKANPGLNTIRK